MTKLYILCYASTGTPVTVEDDTDNVTFVVGYVNLLRAAKEASLLSAEEGEEIIVRSYLPEKG